MFAIGKYIVECIDCDKYHNSDLKSWSLKDNLLQGKISRGKMTI